MTRLAVALAALLLAILPLVALAQTSPEDSLAKLDAALAQPASDLEIAILVTGGATSVRVRSRIASAATDALEALEAVGSRPCYADWWMIAHTAWWLLLRSTEALDAADAAAELLDNGARDLAMVEFNHDVAGVDLWRYAQELREKVVCGVAISAGPQAIVPRPSSKTPTPIQNPRTPAPTDTPTPSATRAP